MPNEHTYSNQVKSTKRLKKEKKKEKNRKNVRSSLLSVFCNVGNMGGANVALEFVKNESRCINFLGNLHVFGGFMCLRCYFFLPPLAPERLLVFFFGRGFELEVVTFDSLWQ
eukprot:TRINITY_DN4514_c0_g1_i1.p8 TRINITY_DN4514_c0_g1~~TRINITY_DN4514_c0_g1_i1.p8  ORF type:complete len:112 (-),score=17.91 TRINITY_DN4514_c0_g1_i1:187-522(-)